MQYRLANEFLHRVYSPIEKKIIANHQTHIILRVMGSALAHTLDVKNIAGFINSHSHLKNIFGECTERIIQFHLNRLKNIGVILEEKIII